MATIKWSIDPYHSEIYFKVKHLMITTVTGYFREFDAWAETQENDFSTARITFEANTASIDTNAPDRDKHLRSADFFDSENHPKMVFTSTNIEKQADNEYLLQGELTIRDITRPITLNAELGGIMRDPSGAEKAGFSLQGTINREEWNLNWNALLESGGVLVSDEVRLFCEVQLVREQ